MNDDLVKNSQEVEDGIYYDSKTGNYFTFIENEETGDAILIEAKDLNLLKRMAKSVKFTNPKVPDTNETDVEDNSQTEEESDYSYGEDYYPDYEPTTPSDDGSSESTPQDNEPTIR